MNALYNVIRLNNINPHRNEAKKIQQKKKNTTLIVPENTDRVFFFFFLLNTGHRYVKIFITSRFDGENQNYYRNGKVFFLVLRYFCYGFFSYFLFCFFFSLALSILWSVASLSTRYIGRSSRVNVACRYVPTVYTNRP